MNVDIITMGCSKNLVDSEQLYTLFAENGYTVHHNPTSTHGDYAVINTCGFIFDAKEESVNTILDLCRQKEEGLLKKVFVMGCLSERYKNELKEEIPQVEHFYGKQDWRQLIKDLNKDNADTYSGARHITTPSHYAYIKIAEGCDRHCAYCAIPIMTGRHKSIPMEDILQEVKLMVKKGVKEFCVIEQELTYYGIDIYKHTTIAELIQKMADIEGVEWIRLHYAYPNNFPYELLKVIRENDNVCKYLDIALQHISDNVLKNMHRHVTKAQTIELIKNIRKEVPGICLRTTILVGFPGETEEDIVELEEFVREARFERLGVFTYSEEEGTFAAKNYKDDVPEEVKQERRDRIMNIQETISEQINQKRIGQTLKVIIDSCDGNFFIGRTEYDTPEVDGEVLIPADENLTIGQFYPILITDANEYDLFGTSQKENHE